MARVKDKAADGGKAGKNDAPPPDCRPIRPAAPAAGQAREAQWDLRANIFATEAILCVTQGILFFLPWVSKLDPAAAARKAFYAPFTISRLLEEIPPAPPLPNEMHFCLGVFMALCLLCLLVAGTAAVLCFCRKRSGIFCCRLAALGAFCSYIFLWSGFQAYGERLSRALSVAVHMTDVPVLGVILSSVLLALTIFYPSEGKKQKKLWE